MKKLSYIIPMYNVEKYIEDCINSLYKQDIYNNEFEVIIINDGCTDHSLNIVQNLANTHSNIIILSKENSGPSAARNAGIERASGEYIMFVDSDDIIIPHTITHILNIASRHKPDIIRGNLIKLNNKSISNHDIIVQQPNHICMTGRDGFLNHYDPNACYSVLNCYRQDFLIKNQLYFEEGMFFEDVVHTTKSYLKAKTFVYIDLIFYIYRQHTSIMSTINECKLKDLVRAAALIQQLKPSIKEDNECRKKLEDSVYQTLKIVVWYLIHHSSMYRARQSITIYMRRYFPRLTFHNSPKQYIFCYIIMYCPQTFIKLAHLFAKTKYK